MNTDLITRLEQTLADIDAGGISPRVIRRDLTDAIACLTAPTEHAELIERLGHAYHEEGCDMHKRLLDETITALRTSYRDGWLGAAGWLKNDANRRYNEAGDDWLAPTNIKTWGDGANLMELALSANHRKSAAQDLRRNAPQEATDEA